MVARDIADLGKTLLMGSSLTVLFFGVWLVAADPFLNFSETWIEIGILGYVLTLITGAGFLGPEARRLAKLSTERDPADPEILQRTERVFMVSRIDLVVLILVGADMVFKPGG